MTFFKQIRPGDDDEEIIVPKRRPKIPEEPKPVVQGRFRFPNCSDGKPALGYATLSHWNIKSWPQASKAEGHNTRTLNTPNAREGAPEPIELLPEQEGSYTDRIKKVLRDHDVPERVRKNGVIATEDVYGASPEYWNRDGDWKTKDVEQIINDPLVQKCVSLARRKHGAHLVSCSLHVDEESPHIHVIAVPLVHREHQLRGKKPKDCQRDADGNVIDNRPKKAKWTLDASSLRGQSSQLEKFHDDWAAECADLRLVRGARGSDMTKEQRNERRSRQTGQSSMAEKKARENRERLAAEASADRAVAGQLRESFERTMTEADEYERLAKEKSEAAKAAEELVNEMRAEAEAALARAKAQEQEWADLVLTTLDEQRVLAEKCEAAEAAVAAAETAKVKSDLQTDRAALETEKHKSAAKRFLKSHAEVNARSASLMVKEADLAHREGQLSLFLAVVSELCDSRSDRLTPVIKDGNFSVHGALTADEQAAITNCPQDLKAVARLLVGRRAGLDEQTRMLAGRGAKLLQTELAQAAMLEEATDLVKKAATIAEAAQAFEIAWRDIPDDQRAPKIQRALDLASGLRLDDVPLGFNLPGRGGAGR